MPLVSPLELVRSAATAGRAVIAGNVSTLEMAQGVVAAAEATNRPLIVQCNEAGLAHLGGAAMAAAVVRTLAEASPASIALHLDHADDPALLDAAARAGFTALMIDGSTLPPDAHLALTQEARGIASGWGLPLEGELGHVSGTEAGVRIAEERLTDPATAAAFVQATQVDWLAVSVGNVHGASPPDLRLDLDRLAAIHAATPVPLVLHGASGVPTDQMAAAVARGVAKINVGTGLHRACRDAIAAALHESADLRTALARGRDATRDRMIALLTAPYAAAERTPDQSE